MPRMNAQEAAAAKLARMPANFRRNYREAMAGRSRAAAMDAFCWECMGWESAPGGCMSPGCPLFSFRPVGLPKLSPTLSTEQRDAISKRLILSRKHTMPGQTRTPEAANA